MTGWVAVSFPPFQKAQCKSPKCMQLTHLAHFLVARLMPLSIWHLAPFFNHYEHVIKRTTFWRGYCYGLESVIGIQAARIVELEQYSRRAKSDTNQNKKSRYWYITHFIKQTGQNITKADIIAAHRYNRPTLQGQNQRLCSDANVLNRKNDEREEKSGHASTWVRKRKCTINGSVDRNNTINVWWVYWCVGLSSYVYVMIKCK